MVELRFYCFWDLFLLSLCLSLFFLFYSSFFSNPSAPFCLTLFVMVTSTSVCMLLKCKHYRSDCLWTGRRQTNKQTGREKKRTGTQPVLTWCLEKSRRRATEVKIVQRWNQSDILRRAGPGDFCVDQPGGFRSVPSTGLSDLLRNINSLKELSLCSRSTDLHPPPQDPPPPPTYEQLCQAAVCTPKEPRTCHLSFHRIKTHLRAEG